MSRLREVLQTLQTLSSAHPEDDLAWLAGLRRQMGENHPLYETLLAISEVRGVRKGPHAPPDYTPFDGPVLPPKPTGENHDPREEQPPKPTPKNDQDGV